MRFTKAHGLGNDFILVAEKDAPAVTTGTAQTTAMRFTTMKSSASERNDMMGESGLKKRAT